MPVHIVDTPIGPLTLVASDQGLHELWFPASDGQPVIPNDVAGAEITRSPDRPGHEVLASAVEQLAEYFAGTRRHFDLPLVPRGTAFQQAVWAALLDIPYGTTSTYGQQAAKLGDPKKVRAVGAANGRNPIPVIIPCHRVLGANGHLVGFGGGLATKAWLLDLERWGAPPPVPSP
jgi:methylated-DNA-[protein]-cysteine S-methyltransferase